MSLTPTNKNNPCAICEDTESKCRQGRDDLSYWQCVTYADAKKGEIVGAYKCIGHSRDKRWAQFKPDNSSEWTEDKRREWQIENRRRGLEKARKDREAQAKSLSDEKRNEEYSKLFDELRETNGLKSEHRADLIRRGLTDSQIELFGAVSFVGFQKLQRKYSELLPGIAANGKQISVGGTGYIYPIRNSQGQIVGAQIRAIAISGLEAPETEVKKQPKYKWLSGGAGTLQQYPKHHKKGGELPLAVHYPAEIKKLAIGICEGTGVKPFLAAQKLGIPFIGASGGQHASSPGNLTKAIREAKNWLWDKFNTGLGEKAPVVKRNETNSICEIRVYPDANCIHNPAVMIQLKATTHELRDEAVKIAWWGQTDKEVGDIDEIDLSKTSIRLYDVEHFWELALDKHEELSKADLGNQKPEWVEKAKGIWRKRRRFTAQHTIKTEGGWFEWGLPPENSSFFGRSGLGTGKTTWLCKIVELLADEGFIFLGYRNTLLLQLCAKIPDVYHLHEHEGKAHVANLLSKLACCVDSLIHFQPEDFDGRNIILDEVMSVVRHLQESTTIKNADRVQYLFSEAIRRAKRVICLDGLLADWVVDYVKAIDPNKEIITVKNLSSRPKAPINLLMGVKVEEKIKKNDRSPWLKMIFEDARTPAICSDSQIFCEALDELLSAQGLKVFRADSKTVSESYVKEFLRGCDAYLRENKPDVIIYSPTAESGLDISIQGYFTHHFCFFFGVLGVDSIIQMLGRVRDTIPKYVWCQEWSAIEAIESKSPYDRVVRDSKLTNLLADLIASIKESENTVDAILKLKKIIDDNIDEHLNVASIIKSIANFERSNLRDCLIEALETEGWKVKQCIEVSDPGSKGKVKEESKAVKRRNCADIFNAEKIPLDQFQENNYDASWAERVKTINANYRRRLPGIENTVAWIEEFIHLIRYDDRNFISHTETRWLLRHPEVALRMQQKEWSKKLSHPSEQVSLIRLKSQRAVIEALRELNIEQFIETDKEWHQDCKEFKEVFKKGKDAKIVSALGFSPGKLPPSKYVGKVLELIGYGWSGRLEKSESKRYYSPKDENAEIRGIVLECISTKWGDYLEKGERLYWEKTEDSEEGGITISYSCHLSKEEEKEAISADESDMGSDFEVLKAEDNRGTNNPPKLEWEPGFKLVEFPSQFRDRYVFEAPNGERLAVPEGGFRLPSEKKEARRSAMVAIKRLEAPTPQIINEEEMVSLYSECEKSFELGLISQRFLSRVIEALGKASRWIEETPNALEVLAAF